MLKLPSLQATLHTSDAPPSVMPAYNARIVAYLGSAATLVAGIAADHFNEHLIWFVPAVLLWPHAMYFAIKQLGLNQSPSARENTLLLDAALTALFLILIDFSLSVSMLFALNLSFSFMIVGGVRLWILGSIVFTSLLAIYYLVTGPIEIPQTPSMVTWVSGISTSIYVSITAYYTHQQARALGNAKSQIQHQREQSITLSQKLAKYLSPQVWESIFTGERDVRLETSRKKLTIFFSDIKGFTELSEEMEPEALTEILNSYFNEMSQIALKYGGTIDKFVGDSMMIFFGDPTSRGTKEDTLACVAMAIEMRKHMKIMRQKWQSQGVKTPLQVRIGISTGFSTVGNFGAENRMDYTIIGKEVNLASRLESLADPGEILVSYETFAQVKDKVMCRDKGEITVKGFSRPIPIYQIIDFRRDIGAGQSFIEHETEGFALYLDTDKIDEEDKSLVVSALEKAALKLRGH